MEPVHRLDDYGIPMGPARDSVLSELCRNTLAATDEPGTYLHVITTTHDVQLDDDESLLSVSVAAHKLIGHPLSAVWGMVAPADASAVALHYQPQPDEPASRHVLLVTRYGDAMNYTVDPDGTTTITEHGDLTDVDTVAALNVLRCTLGLPVDTDPLAAKAVFAAWVANTVDDAASSLPFTGEELDDALYYTAIAATARIVGDYPNAPKSFTELVEQFTVEHNPQALTELETAAQTIGHTVTWRELATSTFRDLLPYHLQNETSMLWAGDGMAAWWMFHQHAPTPDQSLAGIAHDHPGAAQAVTRWLTTIDWWPAPVALDLT